MVDTAASPADPESASPLQPRDTPLVFTSLAEILARESFDEEAAITVDNVSTLPSVYRSKEWAACQVHDDGGRCNQKFQHGWLARREDGVEGLIGGICAAKHFNASESFRVAREELNRNIRIDGYVSALAAMLADRAGFAQRHQHASVRLRAAWRIVQDLKQALPPAVVNRLRDMAKTGNNTVVVDIRFVEEDEKGREKVYWQPRDIGNVAGVSAWDETPIHPLFTAIGGVSVVLGEVVISPNEKESDLRKWRDVLLTLPQSEAAVDRLERAVADFRTPENLALLCHLVANHGNQLTVASLVLQARGVVPSALRVQPALNAIKAALRGRFDGREFRVI